MNALQEIKGPAATHDSSSTHLSHVSHLECLQFLVVLQDRHILPWHETMLLQVMSGLRLGPDYIIVLEAPRRPTSAAAPRYRMANTMRRTAPKPPYRASMALLIPCSSTEVTV